MKNLLRILLAATMFIWANNIQAQCNDSILHITDTITSACTQNGQINIGVTGGTAPYTFSWLQGFQGPVISTSQDLTNIYAGNYTLTVTDNNSHCNTFYLYVPGAFQVQGSSTPDNTCPQNSGTASITGVGGNIPYSYLWSNGATTPVITGLGIGQYNATVTDASGCQVVTNGNDSSSIYVYGNPSLAVNYTNQDPTTCANNNGSIATTVSGGTAPYNYEWSVNGVVNPNWTTALITGLAGNVYYNLTVTDANGCYGEIYYDTLNFTSPIQLSATSTPQNCLSLNGTATVVANGSTGPYSYLWSNGGTTQSITSLGQGAYSVTVTDANSCTNTVSAYVQYYSPIYTNVTSTNQLCNYTFGTASCTPTLGTTPYTYLWSNGATTANLGSLSAGSYDVTVTDHVGCTAYGGAYVSLASAITSNQTQTDQVCGGALGSATLAPTGGVAPYIYLWSTGQTSAVLSNLQTGNYYFTITDVNGCQNMGYVFINYNSGLTVDPYVDYNPTCNMANGSAEVYAYGVQPLSYVWSNGATTLYINNITHGNYQVTVTAGNNCTVVKDVYVSAVSNMSAVVSVTPATCIFTNDGSAAVAISGGTAPYQYQWGNGSVAATAGNLNAQWGIGVYITDANGCWADACARSVGYSNLTCAAIIKGTVVDDANGDCIQDNGEQGLQNTYVDCVPGYGTLTNTLGDYQLIVPAGNYALTQHAEYRNQGCPVGSITLNSCVINTTYATNNFYDWPLDVNDLRVDFCDFELPRPGFTHTIRVHFSNDGLFTVNNAVITFVYDAGVSYVSGGSSVNIATNTVTINCPSLAPSYGPGSWGYVDLSFSTPPTTALGTIQTYTATINPLAGDATPPNNTQTTQYAVVSSYDPNYLEVTPKGLGAPGYITQNDSVIKYDIHFQNTGNFTTATVAIRDTLDPNLDLSSIQMGASTVPVNMQLQDNSTLVFTFDPLYLPDSSSDPLNSIGMVSFFIKQKKGLAPGTEIHNKSAIYFDFNLPVPTNATLNTLTDTASGIKNISDRIGMQIMPNPSSGAANVLLTLQNNLTGSMVITDLLGRNVYYQDLNLQPGTYNIPFNLDNAASGVYLVHINDGSVSKCLKFIKE